MAYPHAAAVALLALAACAGCAPAVPGPTPAEQSTSAPTAPSPAAPAAPASPSDDWAPATPRPAKPPSVTATPTPPGFGLPGETALVEWITDGDTIVTTSGEVRVIGIDTPEWGECGHQEATDFAAALLPVGSRVVLTAVPGKADMDDYGRLLRYVRGPDGSDVGLSQISGGYAVARYDSRDGYGAHPREEQYIAADTTAPNMCGQ